MNDKLKKLNLWFEIISITFIFIVIISGICFTYSCYTTNPYKKMKIDPYTKKKSNVSIVIHTFDGYKRYWEGVVHFLQKYYVDQTSIVYFANETMDIDLPPFFSQIKCGKGKWGYRLIQALNNVPTKYVVYMQEDMWLNQYLHQRYLNEVEEYMEKNNLVSVKLFSNCKHDINILEDLNNPLWYIGTHQPSMWNKEYLLSTIDTTMSPFRHETSLNRRLHNTNEGIKVLCSEEAEIAFYQHLSYQDVSRQGKLRDVGKQMLKKEGLDFIFDKDEVFYRPSL
jgi:hypothetical protein